MRRRRKHQSHYLYLARWFSRCLNCRLGFSSASGLATGPKGHSQLHSVLTSGRISMRNMTSFPALIIIFAIMSCFSLLKSSPAGQAIIFTSSLSFEAQPNALARISRVRDTNTIASAYLVYSLSTQLYTLVQHPSVLRCATVVPSMQGAYASPKHM